MQDAVVATPPDRYRQLLLERYDCRLWLV